MHYPAKQFFEFGCGAQSLPPEAQREPLQDKQLSHILDGDLPGDPDAGGSTSSGQGTMVDFTVFIAIASLTALAIPASENG
jgi:hypothetical protein